MYTAKYSSFIRLLFVGLMGLLFIEGTFADSSISIARFDSPLPSPRATVYGIVAPPPAPTSDDPNSTPSQIRHFSLMPPSPLPTPTPIPDFMPPQTELKISGDAGVDGWYRSPVSVTFLITDNFLAQSTSNRDLGRHRVLLNEGFGLSIDSRLFVSRRSRLPPRKLTVGQTYTLI